MTTDAWPEGELERVERCPVCGGAGRTVLHEGLRDRVFRCAPGVWTLHRCVACRSAYLSPRPDPSSIARAYATYHTHRMAGGLPAPGGLRRLRHALRNDHLNARYGYAFRPALPFGRHLLSRRRRSETGRRVRHLALPLSPAPRLLDLGCGNGEFLLRMRAAGWRAEGLEPDPDAVRWARAAGLSVRQGVLAPDTFPGEHFDAITMDHVIEHLHDPARTLRLCHRILRPGGTLWIATPNLDAEGHARFGSHWLGLDPPRHLVLFTPASLRELLLRAGFLVEAGPLPSWAAKWSFLSSAAISLGAPDPLAPGAPRALMPRARYRELLREARAANRRALSRPERAEELILRARKAAGPSDAAAG